jgi:hypothetical protein
VATFITLAMPATVRVDDESTLASLRVNLDAAGVLKKDVHDRNAE